MNHAIKINPVARHLRTLFIALALFFKRMGERVDNVGDLFYHLTVFRRKAGYIHFGEEEGDSIDGFIRFRSRREDGTYEMLPLSFRISNRWLLRRGQTPSTQLIWEVKTAAGTELGLGVHSIVWGENVWKRVELSPFDLSKLPSEEVIQARLTQLRKVQDWFAKYFPAPQQISHYRQVSERLAQGGDLSFATDFAADDEPSHFQLCAQRLAQ